MARPPGRDQNAPMERLVRLIGALTKHRSGAPLAVLLKVVAADDATDEARRKMLSRDLEHLNALGYDIRNVADVGSDGVYVMRARDNRLQVHLTPEQRGELLRAAIAAGLEGMATHLGSGDDRPETPAPASADLDLVQRGTARHCLVRFTYKGEPRVVHPARVHSGPSGWYLSGREAGGEVVKEFVVARMSDIALDAPGTAEVVAEPVRPSLDPLSWQVDPPVEVVLAVAGRAPGARREPPRYAGQRRRVRRRPRADLPRHEPPGLPLPDLRARHPGDRAVADRGPRRDRRRAAVLPRGTRVSPVAVYAQRLAALPRALGILELHPQGLPLADLAAELGVAPADLREVFLAYYLADLVELDSFGLPVVEFFSPGADTGDEADDTDTTRRPRRVSVLGPGARRRPGARAGRRPPDGRPARRAVRGRRRPARPGTRQRRAARRGRGVRGRAGTGRQAARLAVGRRHRAGAAPGRRGAPPGPDHLRPAVEPGRLAAGHRAVPAGADPARLGGRRRPGRRGHPGAHLPGVGDRRARGAGRDVRAAGRPGRAARRQPGRPRRWSSWCRRSPAGRSSGSPSR